MLWLITSSHGNDLCITVCRYTAGNVDTSVHTARNSSHVHAISLHIHWVTWVSVHVGELLPVLQIATSRNRRWQNTFLENLVNLPMLCQRYTKHFCVFLNYGLHLHLLGFSVFCAFIYIYFFSFWWLCELSEFCCQYQCSQLPDVMFDDLQWLSDREAWTWSALLPHGDIRGPGFVFIGRCLQTSPGFVAWWLTSNIDCCCCKLES